MHEFPSDQHQLLSQFQAGEPHALGALLESCRPYVRVIVRRVLTTKGRIASEDESDFVQEALMNASQNMATFRGRTLQEWLGWVRQISLRTSYRLIGGAGTPTPIPVAVYDPNTAGVSKSPSPSDCAIQIETVARMVIVLGKLPEDMQTVLLGRVVDNMDYADIAQQLGRTSGAIRMLYLRAVRRLRQEWLAECSSERGAEE